MSDSDDLVIIDQEDENEEASNSSSESVVEPQTQVSAFEYYKKTQAHEEREQFAGVMRQEQSAQQGTKLKDNGLYPPGYGWRMARNAPTRELQVAANHNLPDSQDVAGSGQKYSPDKGKTVKRKCESCLRGKCCKKEKAEDRDAAGPSTAKSRQICDNCGNDIRPNVPLDLTQPSRSDNWFSSEQGQLQNTPIYSNEAMEPEIFTYPVYSEERRNYIYIPPAENTLHDDVPVLVIYEEPLISERADIHVLQMPINVNIRAIVERRSLFDPNPYGRFPLELREDPVFSQSRHDLQLHISNNVVIHLTIAPELPIRVIHLMRRHIEEEILTPMYYEFRVPRTTRNPVQLRGWECTDGQETAEERQRRMRAQDRIPPDVLNSQQHLESVERRVMEMRAVERSVAERRSIMEQFERSRRAAQAAERINQPQHTEENISAIRVPECQPQQNPDSSSSLMNAADWNVDESLAMSGRRLVEAPSPSTSGTRAKLWVPPAQNNIPGTSSITPRPRQIATDPPYLDAPTRVAYANSRPRVMARVLPPNNTPRPWYYNSPTPPPQRPVLTAWPTYYPFVPNPLNQPVRTRQLFVRLPPQQLRFANPVNTPENLRQDERPNPNLQHDNTSPQGKKN